MELKEIFGLLEKVNEKFEYLNIDAVFSDETENFVKPSAPRKGERVSIMLRTALNDADRVSLILDDNEIEMKVFESGDFFDFYEASVLPEKKVLRYYFKIEKQSRIYYYNKQGLVKNIKNEFDFKLLVDFEVPKWAKGALMYQIFVDRFYNGDKSNDVVDNEYCYLGTRARAKAWDEPVEENDICSFYGGDLQGVIEKLDYLEGLGVEAIYFNPLFVSPSSHKYDIQDYDAIDPHFGVIINNEGRPLEGGESEAANIEASLYISRSTDKANLEESNKLFIRLVKLAHQRNIRVILDGVFNHCGAFNKWLDKTGIYEKNNYPKGAFNCTESKYRDFFIWNEQENDYAGWWGHSNHPKLNFEGSEKLCDFILDIAVKWVSPPFNADGWRLDVAADLGQSEEFNHEFWKKFRRVVKAANPDALILAENYGDSEKWLMGDEWDSIMNYDAFMEPLTWFLTGMEKHSQERNDELFNNAARFEEVMRYNCARFSNESLSCAMNELSNHDHSRFLTRTNRMVARLGSASAEQAAEGIDKAIFKLAVIFQMMWNGAPTIYYGDEVGMVGWTDPDNRRPFPWGKEDMEILDFFKRIIAIRKNNPVFKTGSVDYLMMGSGLICFGRFSKEEKAVVILNNNIEETTVEIPVWRINARNGEGFECLYSEGSDESLKCENGNIIVNAPPRSGAVYLSKG